MLAPTPHDGHIPNFAKVSIAISVVNLICAALLLFLIHLKVSKPLWRFLVTWLTVADIGGTVCIILGNFIRHGIFDPPTYTLREEDCNDTTLCVVQAVITTWTACTSCMWTTAIGVFLLGIVWAKWDTDRCHWKLKLTLHLVCWVFPFLLQLLALCFNAFGSDKTEAENGWCEISSCHISVAARILWLLVTLHLWEMISYSTICNLILVVVIRVTIARPASGFGFFDSPPQVTLEESVKMVKTSGSVPRIPETAGSAESLDNIPVRRDTVMERIRQNKMYFWLPLIFVVIRIAGTIRFFFKVQASWPEVWTQGMNDANVTLLYVQAILSPTLSILTLILLLIFNPDVIPAFWAAICSRLPLLTSTNGHLQSNQSTASVQSRSKT